MKKIYVQKEPIDAASVIKETGTDADGAVITFIGKVRDHGVSDRKVSYLEYESYSGMAIKELDRIASEAIEKWPLNACTIIHRYGKLEIGEISIIIAVASPHRDEAFQASRFIIDTIKKIIPIWKKEVYTDGSEWIEGKEGVHSLRNG